MNKEHIIRKMQEAGLKPPARGEFIFIHWDQIAMLLEHERAAIKEALAEQPAQQQELDELTAQRDKLADILTRTANALKGPPAELSLHSWHDLPEVAQQLKAAQQQEPYGWKVYGVNSLFVGEFAEADAKAESKRIGGTCIAFPLYTSPPANVNAGKPWVGLTEEDIEAAMPGGIYDCLADPWDCGVGDGDYMRSIKNDVVRIVRAIEAKLKEKNGA